MKNLIRSQYVQQDAKQRSFRVLMYESGKFAGIEYVDPDTSKLEKGYTVPVRDGSQPAKRATITVKRRDIVSQPQVTYRAKADARLHTQTFSAQAEADEFMNHLRPLVRLVNAKTNYWVTIGEQSDHYFMHHDTNI